MIKATYRTPSAFFVSPVGRRLQKQIENVLSLENLNAQPAAFIGSDFPFLEAFKQNAPEIISETETFSEMDFHCFPPQSFNVFFISALSDAITGNLPFLIKNAALSLKTGGEIFILIKNLKIINPLAVNTMAETNVSLIMEPLQENGLLLQNKKELLYFPYAQKIFDKADEILCSSGIGRGCFSLFKAVKNPPVMEKAENYSSTRITKASVLTSPRT